MLVMWTRDEFRRLICPAVLGMVHLDPLPGSPGYGGDLAAVLQRALADASALSDGGVRAFMVENYGDVPFLPGPVAAETVAAMSVIVAELRKRWPDFAVGVNVLRNDARSALAVAAVTGACMIRVNVHVGATVTDQGLLQGEAWRTLRHRRELNAQFVGVLADLRVKHGRPLAERPLAEEARDLRLRGLADAVILTGPGTGFPADLAEVREVREALPDCPLLLGSGATVENVAPYLEWVDGVIVGSSLKHLEPAAGETGISRDRTREFLTALTDNTRKGTAR